jgi:predicted enzyme related to lactoylglutathione lyase
MSHAASPFVWYELMTTDLGAAEAFYRQAIGWTIADAGMPDLKYSIASAGGRGVAGMMTLPPEVRALGVPPNWTGYIGVADVDAWAERIRAAGGTIHHPPTDIPGVGRFAVVADPQGAAFALYKGNSDDEMPPATNAPGTMGWHELYASDLDAAWAFYSAMFGWTKGEAIDMGPMGVYQLFVGPGSHAIGGMMKRPPEVPAACWLYYVNVEAIDAAMARVLAGGGRVLMGPQQVPGGSWIAQCTDPQGAMFAMVAPRR